MAKTIKLGAPTKRPADLAKSVHQPSKGKPVTAAMVRKARDEWGIEPHAREWIALAPGRGSIVHAATGPKAKTTLCGIATTWKHGSRQVDSSELTCLWCMSRIETFGGKS